MAETIVFGGQKFDIDPNDELWKQLVEKYAKKKTGWELPEMYSRAYMADCGVPSGVLEIDQFYRFADNADALAWNRAAVFENEEFCKMQARAETIRRRMLRWAAENDKPLGRFDAHWGVSYDEGQNKWIATYYPVRPNVFGVYFSSEEVALEAVQHFSDDLKWMIFEYKRRLDQEV